MRRRFQFSLRGLLLATIPTGLAFCVIRSFMRDPELFGTLALALCLGACVSAGVAVIAYRAGERRLALLTGALLALIGLMALAAQMTPS